MRLHFFFASLLEWALILCPLMLYLLFLGLVVNRRKHPVPLRGDRSFARLLLGLSGFLLLGPPTWVAHLFKPWGPQWYWFVYGLYLIVLGIVAAVLIQRRRRTLVVYNVDPDDFGPILQAVLDQLQLPYVATPGRVAFTETRLLLDLETIPALNNVSLIWRGPDETLPEKIEQALVQRLAEVDAGYNPACYVLTCAGLSLFLFIFFVAALFLLPPL